MQALHTRVDEVRVMHIIVPKLFYLSLHCHDRYQIG